MPQVASHFWEKYIRRGIQVLVLGAIFIMNLGNIAPENDIYWQLKIGESILAFHHFPTTDPYNLTNPHAVWTLEEWIVEVLFYFLQVHFGWGALILLKAVVITATFWLLLALLNRMKVNLYVSLLAVFLAAMVNTRGYWTVFPSIFEYLFIVFTFFMMEQCRAGKWKYVPIVIPLFSLLWANAHASFFLLEGITFCYVVGSMIGNYVIAKHKTFAPIDGLLSGKQILSVSLGSCIGLLMPFLSPNGMNTWIYPFIISSAKFATQYVNEYISFPTYIQFFADSYLVSFSIVLFASIVALFLISRKKLNPIDVLLFILFSYLAYRAFRHIAIFSLIALPIFARYAGVWFREYRGWLARSLTKDVVVIILILFFTFWYKTKQIPFGMGIDMSDFPVGAAEFVTKNHIAPNMFNHYNYGGFLIWKMTGYQVFIDGRLEMYLGQAGDDYLTLLNASSGWEKVVEKYHVNFLLNYAMTPITKVMLTSPDWKLLYVDSQYVVFVKNSPQNQAVIRKYYSQELVDAYKREFFSLLATKSSKDYDAEGLKAVTVGNIQLAITNFRTAVLTDPNNLTALLNLAQAYFDTGDFDDAAHSYRLALLLDKDNLVAKKQLQRIVAIVSLQ